MVKNLQSVKKLMSSRKVFIYPFIIEVNFTPWESIIYVIKNEANEIKFQFINIQFSVRNLINKYNFEFLMNSNI